MSHRVTKMWHADPRIRAIAVRAEMLSHGSSE